MAYDSKETKESLENVLDITTYQSINAEQELSEMLNEENSKPNASLKTVLERLSKVSAYMQELNTQEELLLAELNGNSVKDQTGSTKNSNSKGVVPNLIALCEILEKKMQNYQKNIDSLKNIVG